MQADRMVTKYVELIQVQIIYNMRIFFAKCELVLKMQKKSSCKSCPFSKSHNYWIK